MRTSGIAADSFGQMREVVGETITTFNASNYRAVVTLMYFL